MVLIVTILTVALGVWLLNNVRVALVTGRLRHSDSTSIVIRSTHPKKYWFILIVQLLFGCLLTIYALNSLITALLTLFE